uniref:Metalloendopeptidase n=1 Tax=Plectus sambesii TaxID=2011161 RepID=A0A914UTV4_9BILA
MIELSNTTMRLLFLTFSVVLLTAVLIRAIPVFADDEDDDEVDFGSGSEDKDVGKMKTNPQLELMREKLKKLKIANADRARIVMDAPGQAIPRRSTYRNITRSVFPSVEKINERFADYLYQSDILLTLEQVDDLLSQNALIDSEDDEDSDSTFSEAISDKTRPHRRIKRKVITNPLRLWSTKEPISYYISADLTAAKKQVIASAVNFWQNHTCLTFRKVETLEGSTDVIRFFNGPGCFSNVGRVGGIQKLSVGDGCEHVGFGIVSHEIGHALGFGHEQSRFDRDSFVDVLMVNIQPEERGNFDKQTANSIKTYDIPYEYGSIMHYEANSFAINEYVDVLVATNQLFQQTMGQRTAPSFFDVYQANRHYKCLDICSAAITTCQNGGYPNPKNCNKCICPVGFGGDLCSDPQRTQGDNCGQRLTATEDWQLLEASVGENLPAESNSAVWEPIVCSWHITAPKDKTVDVRVIENRAECRFGCDYNALQIKTNTSFNITGMRVCCPNDNRDYIYQSEGNLMPIIAEAYYRFSFKLQYRISIYRNFDVSAPPTDCRELLQNNRSLPSGVYTLSPPGIPSFNAYCDMETDGGGWTVFQRRINDDISFNDKSWSNYKTGFNNGLDKNLWLGNDIIHVLSTKDSNVELRIDLWHNRKPGSSNSNGHWWEKYSKFFIESEANSYALHLSSSYAGDATTLSNAGIYNSNGLKFSTFNTINGADPDCFSRWKYGAWWMGEYCAFAGLNGKYNPTPEENGISWYTGTFWIIPVQSRMMLRSLGNANVPQPSSGGCLWLGEAPFCSRDCPDDYDFIREHNGRCSDSWFAGVCIPDTGFGKSCSTILGPKFKKRFCCKSDSKDCTWGGRWVDANNAQIMKCDYSMEGRCGRFTCSADHRNLFDTSLISGANCDQLQMWGNSGKMTCGYIVWVDSVGERRNRWYKTK